MFYYWGVRSYLVRFVLELQIQIKKGNYRRLQLRFFQGVMTSCRSLSSTWNFPDTVTKKALLAILKHEERT